MSTKHNYTPPDYLAGLPSLPDHLCDMVANYSNPLNQFEELACNFLVKVCAAHIRERNEAKGRIQNETRDASPRRKRLSNKQIAKIDRV